LNYRGPRAPAEDRTMMATVISYEAVNATKERAARLRENLKALTACDWRREIVLVNLRQAEHDLRVATGYHAGY
jgi:hypothetical protein